MRQTGVNCTFKLRDIADAVSAFELVPEGVRVRLYSVVWFAYGNTTTLFNISASSIILTNGQSGDVLYRVGFYQPETSGNLSLYTTPQLFPRIPGNGILFDNGIWAQGTDESSGGASSKGGVLSVSITYQGGGSSV
ncbi:hypothetical protein CMI37_28275 [Candidatus Pacearchaeota archaeon]|nr:hypothetical protein [Candidatus Pacearchaeota archaeon]